MLKQLRERWLNGIIKNMKSIEKSIGYTFKNKTLLETAFTHSSYANENKTASYERLEFLGDAILDFVAGEKIFLEHPEYQEGKLSRLRSELVCEGSLYKAAKRLGFPDALRISRGEEKTGGRDRVSVLADTVEAVAAAIYLDSNIENAKRFILDKVLDEMNLEKDSKSLLQEKLQINGAVKIKYEEISESGPDHDKTFTFAVKVNDNYLGEGSGKTKQEAQQSAAAAALRALEQ